MHQVDSFAHDPPVFRVGVVPLPGFPLMSYACTVEPLRAANLLSRRELYSIVHFADEATSRSSGLSEVARTHAIGAIVDLDLLLVVAGGDPLGFDDPAVVSWLQKLATHV
ncbi:MAG: GlxA family transcriptional regulator, partial [Rhodobacteraceae bacterium]|nr:GlxA family transcriptional regulator [Paracoccaceae bacterium]